ncbi:MAG: diguanylate cyclase, partial [Dehalococcoidia bacterium]
MREMTLNQSTEHYRPTSRTGEGRPETREAPETAEHTDTVNDRTLLNSGLPVEASQGRAKPGRAYSFGYPRLLAVATVSATVLLLAVMYLAKAAASIPLTVQISALAASGIIGNAAWAWTHRRLQKQTAQASASWRSREAELERIASREDLTRLYNRRYFYSRLEEELELAARKKQSLSILMIDLDDLKRINDEFGHQVGDSVLRNFAAVLQRCAGADGLAARLGGDEFAVIISGADRKAADQYSQRLWDELAANPIHETPYASIYLGVSIGVSGYPWGGRDIEEIIHWADVNLYTNKLARKGTNHTSDRSGQQELSAAVVEVLSAALEVRDKMTHRHAKRVARLSATLAREMGLNEEDVLTIEYAAALHDIGKIGVPDEILGKPAALDGPEWESMRSHSKLGYEILKGVDILSAAAEIVYAHHERFDGSGYPRGLRGEEIALGARLFMV